MKERFNPSMKLAIHPQFANFVAGRKVYPVNIEVSPSQVCNAQCDWCFYSGTHEKMTTKSILDEGLGYSLIEQMCGLDVKALTWTGGGEPTLHPNFYNFTQLADDLGLKQGLFTNGLLKPKYNPEFFEWIRVSNTDKDWNEKVLRELRDRTKVLGMAYNYTGPPVSGNLGDLCADTKLARTVEIAERVGVNYLQIRQALNLRGLVTDREPPKDLEKNPRVFITTYKFDDSANPHGYERCYGFNFVPFIWHNGDVDVCGYHPGKGSPYTLGNLNNKKLKQIFDEAPAHVPVIDSCQVCCKNHEINKLINTGLSIKDKDFV